MSRLQTLLDLASPPIAISFLDHAPEGVAHVAKAEPAGCGYWRRAAAGEVFYTDANDHLNCPVGAHTHNVPMSGEKQKELEGLVGVMVGLEYLTMADIPKIPQRKTPFQFAVYAPLDQAPVAADVVLVRGDVRQLMLLAEAAQAAGVGAGGPTLGRPTCAVLPETLNSERTSSSFGCVGNRVYTGAGDNEGYFAIPGAQLAAVEAKLETIINANRELKLFHQARQQPTV